MAILSKRLMSDAAGLFADRGGGKVTFMDVSGRIHGQQDTPVAVFTRGRRNYALQESINYGEPFALRCSAGVLCWVLALEDKRRVFGAAIGEPAFMSKDSIGEAEGLLAAQGSKSLSTIHRTLAKMRESDIHSVKSAGRRFEESFYNVSGWDPVLMRENRIRVRRQVQLAESIQDQRSKGSESALYAFEKERVLLANIRAGERNAARSILNGMLSNIYLATDKMSVLRARTVELMSYLTRAAVEDNPLMEPLVVMNHDWTERLTTAETFEALSERLMGALDEFIDAVYAHGLNRQNTTVGAAMDYVRRHYMEQISLKDVAGHVGLSSWRTAHIVKEHTGKTVLEIILDLRIRRAQQLLAATERSCTEICFEVGFNDQSYFTKQFRKHTGVTPSKYRKGQQ